MKTIASLFSLLMLVSLSAQSRAACKLPIYIESAHGTTYSTSDSGKLFIYGLKSAVTTHDGCVVDKMADARLSLFITTVKLVADGGSGDSSVVSVALAVPLNGVPVYMDDYVLVIRNTDSLQGRVDALLQSIGDTLDRYSPNSN